MKSSELSNLRRCNGIESVNLPLTHRMVGPYLAKQDAVQSAMTASKCLSLVQILAQKTDDKGSPTRPWSDATDKDYDCGEIVSNVAK